MKSEAKEFRGDLPKPTQIGTEEPERELRSHWVKARCCSQGHRWGVSRREQAALRGGEKERAEPCLQPSTSLGIAGSFFLG